MRQIVSYFIIIRGPLGSGKSTLSTKLASKLGAELVKIDDLLENLGLDEVDEKENCVLARNFMQAIDSILPEAKRELQNSRVVIFDACFYHQQVVEYLLEQLPFSHYVFTLKAPIELCIKRDSEREKDYGEDAVRAVYALVSKFDYGNIIDVSCSVENSMEVILSYLPAPGR